MLHREQGGWGGLFGLRKARQDTQGATLVLVHEVGVREEEEEEPGMAPQAEEAACAPAHTAGREQAETLPGKPSAPLRWCVLRLPSGPALPRPVTAVQPRDDTIRTGSKPPPVGTWLQD